MSITITVPNNDHVALRAMAKALEEIAVSRGAPAQGKQIGELNYKLNIDTTQATAALEELVKQAEPDTTSQQVESLGIPLVQDFGGSEPVDDLTKIPECGADSTATPWDERIHSTSKALNSDGTWRLRRKPKDMDEAEWLAYVETVKAELMWKAVPAEVLEHMTSVEMDSSGQPAQGEDTVQHGESDDSETVKQQKIDEIVAKLDALYETEPPVTPAGDDFHVDAGVVTEQQVAAPPLPVPPLPYELDHRNVTEKDVKEVVKDFSSSILKGISNAQVQPVVPVPDTDSYTFPQVMKFLTERHARISSAQVEEIIREMGLTSIMDLNTQPEHTGPFIARVKAHLGE